LYPWERRERVTMPATTAKPRDALRQELREALRKYLEQHGGRAVGAEAVRHVALEQNVDPSHVAAAMWTLVDEGIAEYGRNAELTLA
jgi:hypothetical protein